MPLDAHPCLNVPFNVRTEDLGHPGVDSRKSASTSQTLAAGAAMGASAFW